MFRLANANHGRDFSCTGSIGISNVEEEANCCFELRFEVEHISLTLHMGEDGDEKVVSLSPQMSI